MAHSRDAACEHGYTGNGCPYGCWAESAAASGPGLPPPDMGEAPTWARPKPPAATTHAETIRRAIYANGPQEWDVPMAALESLLQQIDDLDAALISMRILASVAHNGDPWYAENEGIDASAIFAQARAALGEEPKS